MQGLNIAEEGHVTLPIPPVDVNGGWVGARFNMKTYRKASIIVMFGVTAAAAEKILVKNATAITGGTATAIPFNAYRMEAAGGDVLGAREAIAATGLVPVAADGIFYVIDLDARELTDGYPFVEVSMEADSGTSVVACVVAVLTGGRFHHVQSETVEA